MKAIVRPTMVLAILLLACNLWAQNRPVCETVLNPYGFPLPQPPTSPGACFYDGTGIGTICFVSDGARLLAVLNYGTDENDFLSTG
jgi:hypothetical protein